MYIEKRQRWHSCAKRCVTVRLGGGELVGIRGAGTLLNPPTQAHDIGNDIKLRRARRWYLNWFAKPRINARNDVRQPTQRADFEKGRITKGRKIKEEIVPCTLRSRPIGECGSFENNVSPSIPVSTLDRCAPHVRQYGISTMYISFLYRCRSIFYTTASPLPLVYFRFFFLLDHGTYCYWRRTVTVFKTVTNGLKTRDNMKILRVLRVTVLTREPWCTTKGRFIISKSHCKMVWI